MDFWERLKIIFLWSLTAASFAYLVHRGYLESLKHKDPPEYFSGLVVYEDYLSCGLVKTRNMDRLGCSFRGEICSSLRERQNRRVRISGQRMPCGPGADFRCAKKGEFNEDNFVPEFCYRGYSLIKVFEDEQSSNP